MGKILNLMRNDVYEVAQRFWEIQSTHPEAFERSLCHRSGGKFAWMVLSARDSGVGIVANIINGWPGS